MIGGLNRRLLLAVAALAGAGTAFAADDDTMRLGRFTPADKADAAKGDTATLAGKDDDTELIHWNRRGFHGGGFYGGGYVGRGYYGGGYVGRGYSGPAFGFSFYRPALVNYYRPVVRYSYYQPPMYYSTPTYYSMPTYYVAPNYYYGGLCPIGGSYASTMPLQMSAPQQMQPGPSFIPPAQVPQPMPPAGSFRYDGDPKSAPLPMPMTVPDSQPPSAPQRPESEGVRVSLPGKAEPSKYKYAAYGEKK